MRALLSLGILLLLLTPRVGGAQEAKGHQQRARLSLLPEAAGGVAPASDLSRALRVTGNNRTEVATEQDDPMEARVLAEGFTGALCGAGGLLGGLILGSALTSNGSCTGDSCALNGLVGGLPGMAVGYLVMVPFGVYLGGNLVKGQGLFVPTLVGSVLGSVAGLGLAILPLVSGGALASLGGVVLLLSPIVGSIIGYEASHSSELEEKRNAASGVRIVPSAGVSASGTGVFGLAGRF